MVLILRRIFQREGDGWSSGGSSFSPTTRHVPPPAPPTGFANVVTLVGGVHPVHDGSPAATKRWPFISPSQKRESWVNLWAASLLPLHQFLYSWRHTYWKQYNQRPGLERDSLNFCIIQVLCNNISIISSLIHRNVMILNLRNYYWHEPMCISK